MSNPNSTPFSGKSENDSDPVAVPAEKPPISAPAIEMLMNRGKQEEEQQVRAKEKEKKAESDDSDEDEPSVPKRKRVGQALRSLLKRRRTELAAVPAAESAQAGKAAEEQPRPKHEKPAETVAESAPESEAQPGSPPEAEPIESELTHGTELKFDHEEPKAAEKTDSIFDQLRSTAETPVAAEPPADEPPSPPVPPRRNIPGFDMPAEPPEPAGPGFGNLPPSSPDIAPRNTTTIIENNTSAAGHLTTLFAANYLSKRRDRKLKRQDRKLEKTQNEMAEESAGDRRRLSEADKRQHSESRDHQQRLRSVENKLDEQPRNQEASPRIEQADENPATHMQFEKAADIIASPVKVSEVLAASGFAKNQPEKEEKAKSKDKEAPKPSPEQHVMEYYAAEARRHAKETDDEHRELISLQSGEKESDDVRETVFERRHEIKDEPGAATRAIVPIGDTSSRETIVHDEPELKGSVQEQISKAKETARQAADMVRADEDIKEAVRNGFLIGVGTVAVGIIAYLLT